MERPSLAIVIPARNEAPRLRDVLDSLPASLPGVGRIQVVVVDDGSGDDTADRAREHGALVARHVVNLGKGAALRTGCEAALGRGADLIVTMDADGQHEAADLPHLLEPVLAGEADVVLTYREASGGSMPAVLRLGNVALSALVTLFFGVAVRDSQCGLRAFTAAAYPRLRWEARDYSVESEMLMRMARNHLRFTEVPIATVYRDRHKGTQPIDGVRILGQLLRWRLGG
jgi:UDP-N-acetylglucosamine---dolichyl-phosphate N-acetylglucosaminyltransferase